MSQLIQHYQTSFTVVGEGQTGENKLYQAQRLIGEWVKNHEVKRYRALERNKSVSFLLNSSFHRRANYESKYSWCKTNYCKTAKDFAWAMEYTHRDAHVRDINWVSDIGLRCFNDTGNLVVSVRISYKVTTEYALTGESYLPDVSIPWCVSGLLETFSQSGCRFYSGDRDVTEGFNEAIAVADAETAEKVAAYIESTNRKLAVVLLMGGTKDILEEANFLSKNLFAKALVFIVSYRPEIKKVFSRFRLEFNECLFIPTFAVRNSDLAKRLRYSITSHDKVKKRHDAILRGWLGCHPVNENGCVSDIKNVEFLIRRQMYLKLAEDLKGRVPAEDYERVAAELRDVSGLNSLYEEENKELANRVGELEDRTATLEIEKKNLKDKHASQLHNLKATQDSLRLKTNEAAKVLPREYPNSFEALRKFAPFFQHLAFSDNAWEPALAYRQFKDFNVAWEMLYDLDQKMWDIIFNTRGDIEREFEDSTTYEYARGEGKQTKSNSKLSKLRKFVFEGKEYEMWQHLKYGNRPGKQLRIHFAVDNERRRIIVGYIGEHMDNATTSSIH